MAVKIKLKRMGKMRNAQYRIVVADARTKRDGRAIEEIGIYQPKEEPSLIRVDSDRAQYWLGVGAQPTETEEVLSTAMGGDWPLRGERRPHNTERSELPFPVLGFRISDVDFDGVDDDVTLDHVPTLRVSDVGEPMDTEVDKGFQA